MEKHIVRSDESLAIGIQRGNVADMEELTERYYTPLLNYLYRMTGGRQSLAEDMVQETFLRALRKIALFDPARSFKPWLYAIATNIARNYFVQADTRYTDNPLEDSDFVAADEGLEDQIMHSEAELYIKKALQQLPDHQREVVILFYFEELAQKEIAETLNIPLGTVKSRLSLGLKRLRAIIDSMERER